MLSKIIQIVNRNNGDIFAAYSEISKKFRSSFRSKVPGEKELWKEAYGQFRTVVIEEAMKEHGYVMTPDGVWEKEKE